MKLYIYFHATILQVGVGRGNIFIAVLVNFSIIYLPKQHTSHHLESNLCHIFRINIYIIFILTYLRWVKFLFT